MRKMKKALAAVLTATMVMSMGMTSWAMIVTDQNGNKVEKTDKSTVIIHKNYEATNEGTTSPAEQFNFTWEKTSVTDAASGVTVDNMPNLVSVTMDSYNAGAAGTAGKTKDITVTLPTYTSVGVYTYSITETKGDTAGVHYYGHDVEEGEEETIRLVVTVLQDTDGKVRVAAVHTEGSSEDSAKSDNFPNTYSAGSLEVTKEVTGNMGDQSKEFSVTVEFTAPSDKVVREAISYTDGTENKTISTSEWVNGKASAEITLAHGETVTFTNIPYGVTYTVTEGDYTSENAGGYDAAVYTYSDETNKKIDSIKDTVKITNNKGTTVDTGIVLDSMPYMALLVVVALGMGGFVLRKRNEDLF